MREERQAAWLVDERGEITSPSGGLRRETGQRGRSAGRTIKTVAAPATPALEPSTAGPVTQDRQGWRRRPRGAPPRLPGWRTRLDGLLERVEGWRLPAPLDRVLGAEAASWVLLLLLVPIVVVRLTLTVGLRVDGLPWIDNDYWWHLATGNWILDHGRVPTTDPFSWTHGGEEWVAHEWLAAVLFAVADRVGGYAGVIVLVATVAIGGLWWLAAGMRSYGLSRRAICILVLAWGGVFLQPGVMVLRPQVLTFAFLAGLLATLAAYETGHRRTLWLLPPLFALWVNVNLTVLIGGLCFGAFLIDRLLKGKPDRHLLAVGALSGLAFMLNPRGPFLVLTALKYQDSDALRYQYVFEWMEPDLGDPSQLPFLLALPVAALAAWQLLRFRLWPAVPVLILAYQSLTAVRFIPIYVILALFFSAWLVRQVALDRRSEVPAPAPPLLPRARWVPATAVLAVVAVLTVAVRTEASQFRREPIARGYPARAATILLEHYPDARLFNVYDYGGYLIHRFDGEQRVYVDGREEMYGETHLRRYFSLIYGQPGWEETFAEAGIDAVLIRNIDGLSFQIQEEIEAGSSAWEQVYRDRVSGLYVRHPVAAPSEQIGG